MLASCTESGSQAIPAEEAVQLLDVRRLLARLCELLQNVQFGFEKTREHRNWRFGGELFA